MIAHVVLYELRRDLTEPEHRCFRDALATALAEIPSIRHVHLGRRMRTGYAYDAQMPEGYDFIGIFLFDDERGLREYLEHPAHEAVGRMFWTCSARSLALDYELDAGRGISFLEPLA